MATGQDQPSCHEYDGEAPAPREPLAVKAAGAAHAASAANPASESASVSSSTNTPRSLLTSGSESPSCYGSPTSKLWQRRKTGSGGNLGLPAPIAPVSTGTAFRDTLGDLLRQEGYSFPKVIGRSANSGTTVMMATKSGQMAPWLPSHFHKVAVKCAYERRDEGSLRATLWSEFQMLQSLRHPSIVNVTRMIETDVACCMVMELCAGVPLARIFPDWGPRSFSDAITARGLLFEEIASTLVYLHGKSIAHRDLHSENILVKEVGEDFDISPEKKLPRIKIVDFGSACEINGGSTSGEVTFQTELNHHILPPDDMLSTAGAFACDGYALGLLGASFVSGHVTLSKHVWKRNVLELPQISDEKYVLAPALTSYLKALLRLAPAATASARALSDALPPAHQWLALKPQILSL